MKPYELSYTPKVSIIIPAYNAANYLAEAIDSALAQTYPNIEIIVVNDGSKDAGATAAVARTYGERIIYCEKENGGSSSALNAGIRLMTGEWFSWLSHDDLYHPTKVETQIAYLNQLAKNPDDIGRHVLFSASEQINQDGKVIRRSNKRKAQQKAAFVAGVPDNSHLICEPTENVFHGCSGLIHRYVFEHVGLFDETLRLINDVDMWFRIYAAGYRIHYLPEALVQGRIHSKQLSRHIGFSYQNSEQDMYWSRSLQWLKDHAAEEYPLFVRYGCNAYAKKHNSEAEQAFAYVKAHDKGYGFQLSLLKGYYTTCAGIRQFLKKVYIKLFIKNRNR